MPVALTAALGTLAPVVLAGTASAATLGPTRGAGFATVTAAQASQATASYVQLRPEQYATSKRGGTVLLKRDAVGQYSLKFTDVLYPTDGATIGAAHARPVGASPAVACYATRPAPSPTNNDGTDEQDALIGVTCKNSAGSPIDGPFTLAWGRGGAEEGVLVTARLVPQTTGFETPLTVDGYTSNLGTSAPAGTKEQIGKYEVLVPRHPTNTLPAQESVQVSSAESGVCTLLSVSSAWGNGQTLKVIVTCVKLDGTGPVDTKFDLTYTQDVNVLGSLHSASDVHARVMMPVPLPQPLDPFVPAFKRNRINDAVVTGNSVSVLRTTAGSYQVRLVRQAEGTSAGSTVITAYGPDARCYETNSWVATDTATLDRVIAVSCVSPAGTPVDTAFYLKYATRQ